MLVLGRLVRGLSGAGQVSVRASRVPSLIFQLRGVLRVRDLTFRVFRGTFIFW